MMDKSEVWEVDGRDYEGHEGIAPMVFGVGEGRNISLHEGGLCRSLLDPEF
jgi:hypothetical protein